ncbi:hypothetical protein M885DRAFT_619022 [Pelagophyceae sp. CCMP2097]|nr:hypothetical protein M885DRAFT_619022 [Pelagophyceae sp. CCMP2097]
MDLLRAATQEAFGAASGTAARAGPAPGGPAGGARQADADGAAAAPAPRGHRGRRRPATKAEHNAKAKAAPATAETAAGAAPAAAATAGAPPAPPRPRKPQAPRRAPEPHAGADGAAAEPHAGAAAAAEGERHTGVCEWFTFKKKHGFIRALALDDAPDAARGPRDDDIFVHGSDLREGHTITDGDLVEYGLAEYKGRVKAVDVARLGTARPPRIYDGGR